MKEVQESLEPLPRQLDPAWEHRQRCKSLPALQPGESERLMAAFLAGRGVTLCPARYAAPVAQQPTIAPKSTDYGGARVSFPR